MRSLPAVVAVAACALSGCAPATLDPERPNVLSRSGRMGRGLRGARIGRQGEISALGSLGRARIVSGHDFHLGRPRRGSDFFDPAEDGAGVGSLAEWARSREGDGGVPSPRKIPRAPELKGAPPITYPKLEEMRDLVPAYLSSDDARRRIAGAIAAAHYRDRRAVPRLAEMVRSRDPAAVAAAQALGAIGDPRAASALAKASAAGGPIAVLATEALGELRHAAAVPGLLRALSSPNYRLRIAAARGLGLAGGSRARSALVRAARNEKELVEVRLAAASGLARMGSGTEVLDLLLRHAASPTPDRAAAALAGIARVGDPRATEALASGLAFASERLWLTCLAGLVSARGDLAARHLGRLASDRRSYVRDRAELGRALIGEPGADGLLVRLLASPDPAVRIEAATALGFERAPGSTPLAPLEDLLSSDPDVRARRAAAAAIGRLGRKEGLGALSRAVGSGDAVLRAVALAGIAHIRGEKMERLADREKLTAAELAELSRALSQYTLDRVVVSGGKAAAVIVSPDGTKRLVMKGEKVAGGFALSRIVRRGEQASPGGPPAERAVAVLERAGAKVILEEP